MEQMIEQTRKKKLKQQTWTQEVSSLLENLSAPVDPRSNGNGEERMRARRAGELVASHISEYWRLARSANPGPIMLLDMFSGCGGMSTGFRSANGLGPIFDVRGAVDIDPVANRSYAINHGVEPLCEDLAALARSPKKLNEFLIRTGFGSGHPSSTPTAPTPCFC
jgi:DNA (cytosine-5)-methyltransferase 1